MADAPYVHHVRIRYGEVDMQQVVFNAHYLAYCDDAADLWFRSIGALLEGGEWDVMVKKATITWDGGARVHDDLAIAVSVEPVGQHQLRRALRRHGGGRAGVHRGPHLRRRADGHDRDDADPRRLPSRAPPDGPAPALGARRSTGATRASWRRSCSASCWCATAWRPGSSRWRRTAGPRTPAATPSGA